MTNGTPAKELRAAAAKLRALVAAIEAPDLPDQSWHTEACASEERGDCPCIVAQGMCNTEGSFVQPLYYVADAETPECAAYIAAMGPPVALALADWLDVAATIHLPDNECGYCDPRRNRLSLPCPALATARAL